MATRSAPVLRGVTPAGGGFTNVVVPADETWIIKTAHISNLGTASGTFSLNLITAGQPPIYASLANNQTIAAGALAQVETWVVVTEGDTVQAYGSVQGIHFWVSGTHLPEL